MGILCAIMLLGVLIVVWAVADRVIKFVMEEPRIVGAVALIGFSVWMSYLAKAARH